MLRNITILFLFFCSFHNNLAISQQRLIKLYEEDKFEKADKQVEKELEALRVGKEIIEDPRIKYVKSLLYNEKRYTIFNPDSAYTYLISSSITLKALTDLKLAEDLAKNLFDQKLIDALMLEVCENAFVLVKQKNTEDAYNTYLSFYSKGNKDVEIKVIQNRDVVAFETACKANTIQSYKHFIEKYPGANQVGKAWNLIYDMDFNDTKSINTASSYYSHMNNYPKSSHFQEALDLSHECEFNETIIENNINSYRSFVDKFGSKNPKKSIALDTLFNYYEKLLNFSGLEYCVNKSDNNQREKLVIRYHNIYTVDGEWTTLNKFYSKFNDACLSSIKKKDYEIAELGKSLSLSYGYYDYQFNKYDEFIRKSAPSSRAYVALTKMIKKDFDENKFKDAYAIVDRYSAEFEEDKHFLELKKLLESPVDNSIRINEINEINNDEDGGHYMPVVSADEKTLFFCAKDRTDNKGGEDVFQSKYLNNKWSNPILLEDVNTSFGNEFPCQISTDNTSMIIFQNGKLKETNVLTDGYSELKPLSSSINQGSWQCDVSISSDGNALLFSSIYSGNFNYNIKSSNEMTGDLSDYHGYTSHQSDIYVSLKDEYGNWGKAINLGPVINTIHCDRSAFLHPDMKTLYFSSDGHGGFGGLDVFVSKRLADSCWNCWSEPVNLGKEINSTSSDWGYNINTDGDKAYFSRKSKIAYVNLPKHLRPNFVATVSGSVSNDQGEVVACSIKWEDLETGKVIGTSKSNPKDGSYYMVLPLGKNYGYYIEKEGYFPLSNNVDVKSANKPISITENIMLITFKQMIEQGIPVRLNNLFFDTGKSDLLPESIPELKRVAKIIIDENLKVEISGHTDNVGDTKMNQQLSEDRANSVRTFLLTQGVHETLLTTIGYGEIKPVDTNNTAQGKAKNRRVELRFLK